MSRQQSSSTTAAASESTASQAADTKPKHATSDNVLAAQLVDRILRFRAEAKAELDNFPNIVRERLTGSAN